MDARAILTAYLDQWLRNPERHMWGVDAERVTDTLEGIPAALRISHDGKRPFLQIDPSQFSFLFRGITGPSELRHGRLGGGSINTDVRDAARSPPLDVFIDEYLAKGKIVGGHHGSAQDGVYFSRIPLVALSGDKSGPYATPDGMVLVIDPSRVTPRETVREGIAEVTCPEVPLDAIHAVYVHAQLAGAARRISGDVRIHATNALEAYRAQLAGRLLVENACDASGLERPRYATREAKELILERLARYPEIARASEEALEALRDDSPFRDVPTTAVFSARMRLHPDLTAEYPLLVKDIMRFREGLLTYARAMREEVARAGIAPLAAIEDIERFAHSVHRKRSTITEQETDLCYGRRFNRELHHAFFG